MYQQPDRMDIYYNNVLVVTTGGLVSGSGTLSFDYNPPGGGPYFCVIKMSSPNGGTQWDFTAHCPVIASVAAAEMKSDQANARSEFNGAPGKLQARVFPNPGADVANLQISGVKGKALIVLSDITGKELWRISCLNDGRVSIPVAHLSSGTYIITITNSIDERKTLKLVKSR